MVPARAGVFRVRRRPGRRATGGPRASGGVPANPALGYRLTLWSPRERGCSARRRRGHRDRLVVPARAGVFRTQDTRHSRILCGPRASGGVPGTGSGVTGTSMWSPRERGCSVVGVDHHHGHVVVPARAGVFRSRTPAQTFRSGGLRASGGVPVSADASQPGQEWSPRERGCSAPGQAGAYGQSVVPARAGVFRRTSQVSRATTGGPRASGGVPPIPVRATILSAWSPRERGCSGGGHAVGGARVVPARAWVFRKPPMTALPGQRGPRASGGGPLTRDGARRGWWSPRAGVFQLRQCA